MTDTEELLATFFRGAPKMAVPWKPAPRSRRDRTTVDRDLITTVMTSPVVLTEIDPVGLRASQPWILMEHVAHYLTETWHVTGRTSADHHHPANRFPLVLPDHQGRLTILSGHHRAAAARLLERPLLARVGPGVPGGEAMVTPTMEWHPNRSASDVAADLARLGLDEDEVAFALRVARPPSPHPDQRVDGGDHRSRYR